MSSHTRRLHAANARARDLGDGDGRWLVWHATHATPASIHLPSSLLRPHFSSLHSSFFSLRLIIFIYRWCWVSSRAERAGGAAGIWCVVRCGAADDASLPRQPSTPYPIPFSLPPPACRRLISFETNFLLRGGKTRQPAPPARPHRHAPALRSPSSTAAIDREPHQPLGPHLGAESEWVRAPRGSGSRNVRISRRHRCLPLSESRNDPPHLPWNPGLIPSR